MAIDYGLLGMSPTGGHGLLNMSPTGERGLFGNMSDAERVNAGLRAAGGFGQGLLAAAGPQAYPVSPLATLGAGATGALDAVEAYKANLAEQEMAALNRTLAELDVAKGWEDQQQRAQEWEATLQYSDILMEQAKQESRSTVFGPRGLYAPPDPDIVNSHPAARAALALRAGQPWSEVREIMAVPDVDLKFLADHIQAKLAASRGEISHETYFEQLDIYNRKLAQEDFKNSNTLRAALERESKTFVETRAAYERVKASADKPNAAGDLALIFNYMKILDPGSVVRESEFRAAAKAGAFGEIIEAQINKVLTGEMLADSQRKNFVDRAERLYRSQERLQKTLEDRYNRIATAEGLNLFDMTYLEEPNGGSSAEQEDSLGGRHREMLRRRDRLVGPPGGGKALNVYGPPGGAVYDIVDGKLVRVTP